MREQHNLRTWDGFLRRVKTLQESKCSLLFRGHADSRWSLETTLERHGQTAMPLADYYRMMTTRVRPQLESFTGRRFDIPEYTDLKPLFKDYDEFSRKGFPPEVLSYLIHVRHHRFPSPLLDWTRSPYVAAFFAFALQRPSVKYRSIYAWSQQRLGTYGTDRPELHRIGRFVRTHQRHSLQQCDYSFRATFHTESAQWDFTPHEEGFTGGSGNFTSELLVKFNLTSTERVTVLKFLDAFNLNAYSLFGSEESLMETIAFREFELK
jgi:hypothetical protein